MANLAEIALGLVTVLQLNPEPEPLGVDLWGQSPEQATYLLKSIIDECADGGIRLKRVRIDPSLLLTFDGASLSVHHQYRGVVIQADPILDRRIELHRDD